MTATLDCLRRLVSGCLLAAPVVGLVVGLAVGLVGILAPLAGPAAAAGPQVMDVRLGVHPDRTRLVLDLSGPVPFRIFTLVEPRRVVVDLPPVDWRLPGTLGQTGAGVVHSFRFGQFDAATSRLVLDLSAPAAVSQAFLLAAADGAPDRLVIDLTVSDPASFAAASAATAPPAAAAAAPAAPAAGPDTATAGLPGVQRRPIVAGPRVIAIDAGHGGVDPGAIGVRGTYEKSVTLAYAQALAARLQATGRYRVYLTRDQDTFLRLRDRVALARTQGADLFISLHADSNPDKGLRGASVYTLSETASDAESAALAAKENKADIIAGIDLSSENPEVSGILIDLAQRETMNLSARFAGMLTAEMAEAVTVLRHSHRFAGFAVLKAPDVPSVLLELGYLSNREDEAQLNGADHRRAVGDALVRALDAYFAWADALNRT